MRITPARRGLAMGLAIGLAAAATVILAAGGTGTGGSKNDPPYVRAPRHLYVTVLDAKGHPVPGLTAADFAIAIDGRPQEVLSAGPPTEPLSIALLTDRLGLNSTFTQFEISQALKTLVGTIRGAGPDHHFSLATFDGPVLELTSFKSAPGELDRAIGRLSTMIPDASLLDGLMAACRSLRSAPSARRAIVAVVSAYRTDTSATRPDVVFETLRLSGAALFAVEVRLASGGNYANATRELVLDQGSAQSGGWINSVSSGVGLQSTAKTIAESLLAEYEVVFAPGTGVAQSRVAVTVTRPGVKILAAKWLAE